MGLRNGARCWLMPSLLSERRDNLARIPDTIADLARAYAASGGDPADLRDAMGDQAV